MDLQVQKDKGNPFLTQISLELNEINEEHKADSCILVPAPLFGSRQAGTICFVAWTQELCYFWWGRSHCIDLTGLELHI